MRKLLIAAAATAAAGGLATTTAMAAGRTVKVGDYFFVRAAADTPTVTVAKGTKVTFKWVGDDFHNVRAASGPATFKSATKGGDDYRFSRTLRKKGTYRLVCDVHSATMRMTLRVR